LRFENTTIASEASEIFLKEIEFSVWKLILLQTFDKSMKTSEGAMEIPEGAQHPRAPT